MTNKILMCKDNVKDNDYNNDSWGLGGSAWDFDAWLSNYISPCLSPVMRRSLRFHYKHNVGR